jgi:putative redox protein
MSDNPTTDSTVSIDWLEKDVFVGTDDTGHSIVFDSALSGTPARGFGPMKALLVSLGACSGMDVAAILAKRRQRVRSLKIEIVGKRPQYGHPKPFTDIKLTFVVAGEDIDERYVKEAVGDSIEKYCSVAATIGKEKVRYSYRIVPI